MKGMVFTEFMAMVEDQFGLGMADTLIDIVNPESGGAYTSVGNYPSSELVAMVMALSQKTDTPIPDLLEAFGARIFQLFTQHYGHFFSEAENAIAFLSGIEHYIHVEVRKLYPDAELPHFEYPSCAENELIMDYHSDRPLAHFALGLIKATITHYNDNLTVTMEDTANGKGTDARFILKPG